MSEEIKKARPKAVASAAPPRPVEPHDRRTAKAKLREARTALEQPPVRAGRGDRAGGQGLGTDLRPLRGQSRQGRRRGPCPAPPRQDPQHAAARAVEPGCLRRPGAGIAPAHVGRQARRGRGQGAPGPADERRSLADGRSGRVGPPRDRDGPGAESSRAGIARRQPVAEPPSVVAEREANELLAKGDQAAAAAKFAEAERLSAVR